MARLIIKTEGLGQSALELRMGINRVGRSTDCELHLPHATISSLHCELALSNDGVHMRDCDSTNGTFINGQPVAEPRETVQIGVGAAQRVTHRLKAKRRFGGVGRGGGRSGVHETGGNLS